jgi:sugar lactone lactonase YvrE
MACVPYSPTIALDARDRLGESPVWNDCTGVLLRVDILGRRVHTWDPATGTTSVRNDTDGDVGAIVPCDDGASYVLAIERRLELHGVRGRHTLIAEVGPADDDVRFNDCRCDPQGRLWAGTMSRTRRSGAGALYRLAPGETIAKVLDGTTISNGLGWSPEGRTMYFVDSPTQRIDALDFDGATGTVSGRRTFAEVDPADGLPDGLVVDADGFVWLCLFGGGAIRRYAPDGTLASHVPLPVTNPTCPAFGGPDLRTLYVTSARHRLTEAQLAAEPQAGAVVALDPGVAGLPARRFRCL